MDVRVLGGGWPVSPPLPDVLHEPAFLHSCCRLQNVLRSTTALEAFRQECLRHSVFCTKTIHKAGPVRSQRGNGCPVRSGNDFDLEFSFCLISP